MSTDTTARHRTETLERRRARLWPGLLACVAAAAVAMLVARFVPGLSALLVAIILGVAVCNLAPVPAAWSRGTTFSSKALLRAGIVLLGLQVSLSAIAALGPGVLLVVLASVGITFGVTLWVGRLLGVKLSQRLLIATGFSICGAAAVAGVEDAADADSEEVATAIALVVLFGTLMIPLMPFLGGLFGLSEEARGIWIGASTHEVAHVVAAGGIVGGAALTVAVTVKLARVVLLAPIVALVAWRNGRRKADDGATGHDDAKGKRPPIVPLFVIGFLIASVVRTFVPLPEELLAVVKFIQTGLLAAAMFALGLGVDIRKLIKVGGRPLGLAALSTLTILLVSGVGVQIVG